MHLVALLDLATTTYALRLAALKARTCSSQGSLPEVAVLAQRFAAGCGGKRQCCSFVSNYVDSRIRMSSLIKRQGYADRFDRSSKRFALAFPDAAQFLQSDELNEMQSLQDDKLRRVAEYVLRSRAARRFVRLTTDYLKFLVPHYIAEGKTYLTIAIGCTGGRHRSVAIAEELAGRLQALSGVDVRVRHRDVAIS